MKFDPKEVNNFRNLHVPMFQSSDYPTVGKTMIGTDVQVFRGAYRRTSFTEAIPRGEDANEASATAEV